MIKTLTIALFIILFGATIALSQSNTTVRDRKDSLSLINNEPQTGQFIQLINTKSDNTSYSNEKPNPNLPQIPIEKAYLDVKKAKKDKELMENKNDSLEIQ